MQTPQPLDQKLLSALRFDQAMLVKLVDMLGDLAVNLCIAALILVVTFWASGRLGNFTRRLVARVQRRSDADTTLQSFMASLVRYLVVIVGLVAVLQRLGVQTTSIIAVLGAASLAIGLALQGALSNVAAGVMILLFRPYRLGDTIESTGRKGVVRALDLFVTELSTADNLKVVIPNSKIFGDVIVNYTHHKRRRADAVFKLPVAVDAEMVLARLREDLAGDPRIRKEPPPIFEAVAHTHDGIEMAVRVWCAAEDEGALKSDILRAAHVLTNNPEAPLPALTPPAPRPKPSERAEQRLRLRLRPGRGRQ
jgi:small conductance mechanosensitive channel